MSQELATRDSWQTTPMSSSRVELPIVLRLTLDEFERVKRGNIPEEMEDKWFVFQEDGWVYFHRSWTGYCIYQLRFEQEGDEAVVREAWVTRDPEHYRNDDIAEDEQLLRSLLFYRFGIGQEPTEE